LLDPLDELAYLSLECERMGAAWVGPVLLDRYAERSGDEVPPELVAFYGAYRALIRARLAVTHLCDREVRDPSHWCERAKTYLALAAARASQIG
jgi:aminoglycoside phosphotransferase family enzyme